MLRHARGERLAIRLADIAPDIAGPYSTRIRELLEAPPGMPTAPELRLPSRWCRGSGQPR